MDLLAAAQREHAQLTRMLTGITRRIRELEAFFTLAVTINQHDDLASIVDAAVDDAAATVFAPKIQAPTIKEQVLNTSANLLAVNGRPLQTKELVQGLESRGIKLNGKDKVLQVSAILSKEKDLFVADRKHGWSLRPATKGEGPGASTQEPSGFSNSTALSPEPHRQG